MKAKRKKASGPGHSIPAPGAPVRDVVAVLAGVHPDLRIDPIGETVLVSVKGVRVAEVARNKVRLLPGRAWEPISLTSEPSALRERVADAIRQRGRSDGLTAWARALSARGVPAEVHGSRVIISGEGAVGPPPGEESTKAAAKRFVQQRTEEIMPWLVMRVHEVVDGRDPRVQVVQGHGKVLVRLGDEHVATVTRYSVAAVGEASLHGDLQRDDGPLQVVARAVARASGLQDVGELDESDAPRLPPPDSSEVVPLAGLADVCRFFAAAGMQTITPNERAIQVEGVEARPPSSALRDDDNARRWIDAFVATHFADRLTSAARREIYDSSALRFVGGNIDVITATGARVVRIMATRAYFEDAPEPLEANFLCSGRHWETVRAACRVAAEGTDPHRIAAKGLHRWLPEDVDADVAASAYGASRRLREDRTRAFEHAIRVDVAGASLRFSPVTTIGGRISVEFVYDRGTEALAGALRLGVVDDLMACVWHQPTGVDTLALVWALSLEVYAELTCIVMPAGPTDGRTRSASAPGQRRGERRSEAPRVRPRESRADPAAVIPATLRPQGATARFLASYVAGHRRRLHLGWQRSPDAEANAAKFGIRLGDNETWVQPHVRGVPPDAILHFTWRAPDWLERLRPLRS